MDNCDYFNYSEQNPEEMFDDFYKKGVLVIPEDANTQNLLTRNNAKLIECITAFNYMISNGLTLDDELLVKVVNEVVEILTTTPNINYSAFSQFFMVYNSTYGYFASLEDDDKFIFIYEMLLKFCKERHDLYLSHGYSNSIMQVMSDNYSHKRNSKTTIEKILSILSPFGLKHIRSIDLTDEQNYYFLPDKGDSVLFEEFIKKYALKMQSREIEQNKLPDIVFNCNGQFYICELKTMKGSGGGQNKQIVEVAHFIKFSETDERFHYVVFLDRYYANDLFVSKMPKIVNQRKDIIEALNNNKNNYFVNTAGFKKLVADIFS